MRGNNSQGGVANLGRLLAPGRGNGKEREREKERKKERKRERKKERERSFFL